LGRNIKKMGAIQQMLIGTSSKLVIGTYISKEGGYYFGTYDGYNYICSPKSGGENVIRDPPSGQTSWDWAKNWCAILSLNGKYDWYLPNKVESNYLYQNRLSVEESNGALFENTYYWTSTPVDNYGSGNYNAWA
jgi:hypothetical protein